VRSPQSPIYGKTLARCTRAVYPPRFLHTAARRWVSVFFWLWLGHLYMGSNGFAKHSPRSSIYSETLAHCTHAVYLPRFFRTAAHRWASVFLWLWLDHMYMESKGFLMHSLRSLIYGETLARYTRAVYPLDFSRRRHAGGLVCFIVFG
jgi:hypothetical protein